MRQKAKQKGEEPFCTPPALHPFQGTITSNWPTQDTHLAQFGRSWSLTS